MEDVIGPAEAARTKAFAALTKADARAMKAYQAWKVADAAWKEAKAVEASATPEEQMMNQETAVNELSAAEILLLSAKAQAWGKRDGWAIALPNDAYLHVRFHNYGGWNYLYLPPGAKETHPRWWPSGQYLTRAEALAVLDAARTAEEVVQP